MSPKPILKDKLYFNLYLLHLPCGKRFIIVKANYFSDYYQTLHRYSKAQMAPLPLPPSQEARCWMFWPWQQAKPPRRQLHLRLPQTPHGTGSLILILLLVTFSHASSIFLGKAEAEGLNPLLQGRVSFPSCVRCCGYDRTDVTGHWTSRSERGEACQLQGSDSTFLVSQSYHGKSCNTNIALLDRKPNPNHHLFYKEPLRQQLLVLACPVPLPPIADLRRKGTKPELASARQRHKWDFPARSKLQILQTRVWCSWKLTASDERNLSLLF